MSDFNIVIGNKNYSSWSLRSWLVLKATGASFSEEVIPLYSDDFKTRIEAHSSAGWVPILKHGEETIWDSLAINEYLAELFPEAKLWPSDLIMRAYARSISAEMHSGFMALRQHMPMDIRTHAPGKGMEAGVAENISRICFIWNSCRKHYGAGGDFLFGHFTIADAMFAPVVSRFTSYDVQVDDVSKAYMNTVQSSAAMIEWSTAAREEPWVVNQ